MTLPSPQRLSTIPRHRERLARWLHEWELLKAVAYKEAGDHATPLPLTLNQGAADQGIEPGDVRLLHPCVEPRGVRYVAVVCRHDVDGWLVVPFGLLSEPATPGEVLTDRDTPSLRVLCRWNQFRLTTTVVQRCWHIGQLTLREEEWLRSTPPGDRVGPSLRHPLDPRWDYLEMESEFRQRVSSGPRQRVTYDISPPELRKAAEDQASYGDENEAGPEDDVSRT